MSVAILVPKGEPVVTLTSTFNRHHINDDGFIDDDADNDDVADDGDGDGDDDDDDYPDDYSGNDGWFSWCGL